MCIAIASPIGQKIPNDNILKNCFENNPDGGGFAFNYNGEVFIQKGFMKFDDFITAIHKADEKYDLTKRGVLIHTRITTHGGTNQEMTHPFPICADEGAMRKIQYHSPYAVIHNGIISLTSTEATRKGNMSDTAVFVTKYLTKIATNKNWFDNDSNFELIYDLIDSKMAILNGKGEIKMTQGFTEDNGNFYSNSSYTDNYRKWTYTKCYGWDDDYSMSSYDYMKSLTQKGYVYDTEKKCWSKKKEEQKSKEEKSKSTIIDLMRVKRDESILFADGSVEEYCPSVPYFVTEDYEVYGYYGDDDVEDGDDILGNLEYYGQGYVIDKMLNEVEFRTDNFTDEESISAVSFFDFD